MQPEEDTHADWPDSNRNHKSKSLHSPNFCAVRFAALFDAVFTNLYGCLGTPKWSAQEIIIHIANVKKMWSESNGKSSIAKLTHDTHIFKPSQVSDLSVNAWICIAFIFFVLLSRPFVIRMPAVTRPICYIFRYYTISIMALTIVHTEWMDKYWEKPHFKSSFTVVLYWYFCVRLHSSVGATRRYN